MKITFKVSGFMESLFKKNEDPIENSKKMISSIQQLVGISDVFGDKRRSFSLFSLLKILLFYGTFAYVGTISQFIYLFEVLPDKIESFKALDCLMATSVPFTSYVFMWTSRNRLKNLFQMARQGMLLLPKDSPAYTALLRTLTKAQYMAWMVILNQFISHFFYLLLPFLMTIFGDKRYLPSTPGDTYGLTPKYVTPFFEISFLVTILATAFSAINQTGYIVLFVTLVSHELGHFYAITETLNHLQMILSDGQNEVEEQKEKLVKEKLYFCITHHQFVCKYHEMLRALYNSIFGVHFFTMTVLLVATLQTLYSWDISNTILTGVTGILPLFIYCFGGEMLISAENELSNSLYTCGWEMMSPKQAKMVLLMLCISQRPLVLTAANTFIMNRDTFGNVVQTVYKVYTVFK